MGWMRWYCLPDTWFEIRALAVWSRARYLSVTEAPHNIKSLRVGGEEIFCFFEIWMPELHSNPRSQTFQAGSFNHCTQISLWPHTQTYTHTACLFSLYTSSPVRLPQVAQWSHTRRVCLACTRHHLYASLRLHSDHTHGVFVQRVHLITCTPPSGCTVITYTACLFSLYTSSPVRLPQVAQWSHTRRVCLACTPRHLHAYLRSHIDNTYGVFA